MVKVILSDIRAVLHGIAIVLALISAVVVTLSLGVLTVFVVGGDTANGAALFMRLMNMDTNLYYVYGSQFILKNELFTALRVFNWIVLVGGIGSVLAQSIIQYIEGLRYRGAHSRSAIPVRAALSLRSNEINKDDFKQAGNS